LFIIDRELHFDNDAVYRLISHQLDNEIGTVFGGLYVRQVRGINTRFAERRQLNTQGLLDQLRGERGPIPKE